MREGDPAGVSVIKLHGDQVPVILEAQQACGRRGGVRGPKGSRDEPGSSPGSRMQEGGCAAGRTWASEPGSPGSTGSQSSRARGRVHSSRDPPQINEEQQGRGCKGHGAGKGTAAVRVPDVPKTTPVWTRGTALTLGSLLSQGPGRRWHQREGTRLSQGSPRIPSPEHQAPLQAGMQGPHPWTDSGVPRQQGLQALRLDTGHSRGGWQVPHQPG